MKPISYLASIACLSLIVLLGSSCTQEIPDPELEVSAVSLKAGATTLEGELKTVRKAAMRYHSFQQAVRNGYADSYPFNPSPYVPQMGFHYINVGLMDGTFDMENPEILLYVPDAQGNLKLAGVEYAVPVALSPEAPEGFTGSEDHWEYNPNVAGGAWTLHAWVVLENPEGVFAPHNPNVPVSDPSLD